MNKEEIEYPIEEELEEFMQLSNNLMQENEQLKRQLDYLRSGEYINQLRFERDMLQDLVDKGEISKEDKAFIDCNHRNTELLDNWNNLKEHIQGCLDEVLENDVYDRTSYEQGVIAGLESSLFKLEELENGEDDE